MTSSVQSINFVNYLEKFHKYINRISLLFDDQDMELAYQKERNNTYLDYYYFEIIM